jgi:uncharacterized membrane protein
MKLKRFLKHWALSALPVRLAVSDADLAEIEKAIEQAETTTSAEFLVIFERSLPISYLKRNASCRIRAKTLFGKYGCWDTEENNGVLLYFNLTEHAIEIFLDRGAARAISQEEIRSIVDCLGQQFRQKHFRQGIEEAVGELARLLAAAFPNREGSKNSVSNKPLTL